MGIIKKDGTRFTIRFNPTDHRHQMAMEALNAAGRRKAVLIADALCEYLVRHSGGRATDSLNKVTQMITYEPTCSQEKTSDIASLSVPQNAEMRFNGEAAENALASDDMRKAVLGGLSMFNVQA